jgi:hypothetical protein
VTLLQHFSLKNTKSSIKINFLKNKKIAIFIVM